MNKVGKRLAWLTIIMLISFIISGFFFLKSGLMDFENGGVHDEVVINIEKFNFEMNEFLGIPTENMSCYLDWCLKENLEPKL